MRVEDVEERRCAEERFENAALCAIEAAAVEDAARGTRLHAPYVLMPFERRGGADVRAEDAKRALRYA